MQPLAALLAIVAGSAVALAIGLVMTWVVILFLPAQEARFRPRTAGPAQGDRRLYIVRRGLRGELLRRAARCAPGASAAHALMLAMFAVAVWLYWPQ